MVVRRLGRRPGRPAPRRVSTRPCDRWREPVPGGPDRVTPSRTSSPSTPRAPHKARDTAVRRARRGPQPARPAAQRGQRASAQTDFYSYRYLASEGFLPGYSLPAAAAGRLHPGRAARARPARRRLRAAAHGSWRSASSGPARSSTTRAPATRSPASSCPAPRAPSTGARPRRRAAATPAATTTAARSAPTSATHCGATAGRQDLRAAAAADGVHPPPGADLQRRGGTPPRRVRARDLLPLRTTTATGPAASTPSASADGQPTLLSCPTATRHHPDRQRRPPPAQGPRTTAASGSTWSKAAGCRTKSATDATVDADDLDAAEDVARKAKVIPYVEDRRNILVAPPGRPRSTR